MAGIDCTTSTMAAIKIAFWFKATILWWCFYNAERTSVNQPVLCCKLIQNVLMLNAPWTAAEERSSVRSELKTAATDWERKNGPAIIDCQKCHLLSASEWEEYKICCVMPLWRWITGPFQLYRKPLWTSRQESSATETREGIIVSLYPPSEHSWTKVF